MELTHSYDNVVPARIRDRYDWLETRNAAAILQATNPSQFDDILGVLGAFAIDEARDISPPGGNESLTAAHLNGQFRQRGWREGSYKVRVASTLTLLPWSDAGETQGAVAESDVDSTSYLVDNVKGRVALDVEWHAKDGNLDRDIAAYRSLHQETIIDVGAMITMTRADLRALAARLDPSSTKFKTTTTTNLEKVRPRLQRGDGGGCPVLVVSICARTN